jgi:cytidylate kinase
MKQFINVAIDGPAGAGKSTIAKRVAKELEYIYVDTGAMYRAMAVYLLRNQVNEKEPEAIAAACEQADVSIEYQNGEQVVLLNGENVNPYLRTEETGRMASICSAVPKVRLKLVELQRNLAAKANVIMDGRDIGTYVLPDADRKIYLTASSRTRAVRRALELQDKGIACDVDEIEKDIIERDQRDMNREFAPLRQAEDAVLVDSSDMTIEEVVERIIELCRTCR